MSLHFFLCAVGILLIYKRVEWNDGEGQHVLANTRPTCVTTTTQYTLCTIFAIEGTHKRNKSHMCRRELANVLNDHTSVET